MIKTMFAILTTMMAAGCASILHSVRLPISATVVNSDNEAPISGAEVEIQWRSGFQGYYWGKTVRQTTDSLGNVEFGANDIPPMSEDGYAISDKPLSKLFVSRLIVKAAGFETLSLANPEEIPALRMKPKR